MTLTHRFAVALALASTACGGNASTSNTGEGTTVTALAAQGIAVGLSVAGGDVYAILVDNTNPPAIAVFRVHDGEAIAVPIPTTDWSDYAQSPLLGLNPTKTAVVSGGNAYFLGYYGVTVVPLDGSPSATVYPPGPGAGPNGSTTLSAFAVDGGSVYLCAGTTTSSSLLRYNADGTWDVLFTGATADETCFNGAVTVAADAVYWSTNRAIRAYDKQDGTVRTVVDLGNEALVPPLLAAGGGSIVWFDWFDTAFHAASSSGTTPDNSAALGQTTLLQLLGADPTPLAMFVANDRIYWLTPFAVHRLGVSSGHDGVLAQRPLGTGAFWGLATDGANVYFTSTDPLSDGGSLGECTLRSVVL